MYADSRIRLYAQDHILLPVPVSSALYMLNKKQSDGKIDMAAALVDALAIVQFNIDEDAESSSSHDMLTFI